MMLQLLSMRYHCPIAVRDVGEQMLLGDIPRKTRAFSAQDVFVIVAAVVSTPVWVKITVIRLETYLETYHLNQLDVFYDHPTIRLNFDPCLYCTPSHIKSYHGDHHRDRLRPRFALPLTPPLPPRRLCPAPGGIGGRSGMPR